MGSHLVSLLVRPKGYTLLSKRRINAGTYWSQSHGEVSIVTVMWKQAFRMQFSRVAIRLRHLLGSSVHQHVPGSTFCARCSSTGSTEGDNLVFELRHYRVQTGHQRCFLDLTMEHMHVRASHSPMVGFWYTELGSGINDVVHIWQYRSLSDRAHVRQGLAKDRAWQEGFMAQILPMMLTQKNTLIRCFPGTTVTYPEPGTGHYELQEVVFPGRVKEAGAAIQDLRYPGAKLAAAWYNLFSKLDTGWLLWHHKNLDDIMHRPDRESHTDLKITKSKLLIPMPYSPMK
ncbi:protein NipSnap homolog 3A-like [Mya arenaria]|uniref:protein NipSnap homolog 3A-like n=1 Tax=Mya arenaria TaxID=6604 RepID=UPI0022E80557|nr:protein NipSnap homolog 3A-like [Mya arenaria]XP_052779509.1 protein NipSnap homolog 3A-like [Mya arenaria]